MGRPSAPGTQVHPARIGAFVILWFTVMPYCNQAGEPPKASLPEGPTGIASRFPGDKGIEADPDVVFVENFDAKDLNAVLGRWEDVKSKENMVLSPDVPKNSGDGKSLQLTHVGENGSGGHLYRRLAKGHERLFFRFHVKLDPKCNTVHHFVHWGGYQPPTRWPQGGAGERPKGDERFTIGIEPHGNRWVWDYYAYWMEMRGSPPKGKTWGNSLIRNDALAVKRGHWTCLESMVKLNDAGDTNGELALWIDGKLVSHLGKGFPKGLWIFDKFTPGRGGEGIRWDDRAGGPRRFKVPQGGVPFEGLRWRKSDKLKLNFIWMLLYITKAPKGHFSRVWFDNIVVAKQYIGPIAPRGK